jgi:ubiquinone/menaquinone biosynthesis C-methylase UbiE
MATTAPVDFDVTYLRDQIMTAYDRVAREPHGSYHFHRGPEYAATFVGYDRDELAALPATATARFAGVGNPLAIAPIAPGETVLDHACGAGMDLLLAARRVGPTGRAIGIDMTPAMVAQADRAAAEAGLAERVRVQRGFYEALPIDDAGVDVVISNGVLSLAPDKGLVLRQIHRALRPGGRLYLADVVVQRELSAEVRANPDLWAACIAGALIESELPAAAAANGLVGGRVVRRFNCFYDTTAEEKLAKDLFIQSVNFLARKPAPVEAMH